MDKRRERGKTGKEDRGGTGVRGDGREVRREGTDGEEGGREIRRKGREWKGNLAPTVISKSRRLC